MTALLRRIVSRSIPRSSGRVLAVVTALAVALLAGLAPARADAEHDAIAAAVLSPSVALGLRDDAPAASASQGTRAAASEGRGAIGSGPRVAQAQQSSGQLRESDGMTLRDSLRTRPIGRVHPPVDSPGMSTPYPIFKLYPPPPTVAPPAPPVAVPPPQSEPPPSDPPIGEATPTPTDEPPPIDPPIDEVEDLPPEGSDTEETTTTEAPPPIDSIADAVPELTPEEIAAVSGLAGGTALIGSLTMLGLGGVRREEVLATLRDLLRGRAPEDPFEAWKRKWQGMGWTYSEKGGVATFDPAEGARNEAGDVWSATEKRFLPADPSATTHVFRDPVDGTTNDRGEVWSENDRAHVQRDHYDQERRRRDDLDRSRAAEIDAAERASRAEAEARSRDDARLAAEISAAERARAAAEKAEEARREAIGAKLKKLLDEKGAATDDVDRMVQAKNDVDLEVSYARALKERMRASAADADHWKRWAEIHGAAATASDLTAKVVAAGAKASLLVTAGPTGLIPAALGIGAIRSAEEGARAWAATESKAALGTALVSGFASGAKDGVIGWYVGLARTPALAKVFLPGAADAGEVLLRTGSVDAAAKTFALSSTVGYAGSKLEGAASTVAREVGNLAAGAVAGAAGAAINGTPLGEGAVDGLVAAVGGRAGQYHGQQWVSNHTPMTNADLKMDLEFQARGVEARERVDALKQAIDGGDPQKTRDALMKVLDHREAKQAMGEAGLDPALKQTYADLTQKHRTEPIFEGTAGALNEHRLPGSDQPRFVVRDAAGNERAVKPSDFASGTGSGQAAKPGMDLDLFPKETIIDRATGAPAGRHEVETAVKTACGKLGIDPNRQEVNVTGMKGPEDWTMGKGEVPSGFKDRVQATGKVTAMEGQGIGEVSRFKLSEAERLHATPAGASALAEQARGVAKDQGRLIDHLIAGDAAARVPEVFRRQDSITRETPLTILKAVGDGTLPPGTGNARFREMTGMDIADALPKLTSWAEPMGKWGGDMPTAAPTGPHIVGQGLATNLQNAVRDVIERRPETSDGT
ncbi:MAG: hypothetical protein OEL76_16480 [Siculibacillus sp.]|nr:hypothetical protein [Siculibacillus sp.]